MNNDLVRIDQLEERMTQMKVRGGFSFEKNGVVHKFVKIHKASTQSTPEG